MEVTGFPTSCDIYLELEGKKVAVVQSYTAKATKTSQVVEAFGCLLYTSRCGRSGQSDLQQTSCGQRYRFSPRTAD